MLDYSKYVCQLYLKMSWKHKLLVVCVVLAVVIEGTPASDREDDKSIHLLVTVKNVRLTNRRLSHLALMLDSVVSRAVLKPLHWIFLIDPGEFVIALL